MRLRCTIKIGWLFLSPPLTLSSSSTFRRRRSIIFIESRSIAVIELIFGCLLIFGLSEFRVSSNSPDILIAKPYLSDQNFTNMALNENECGVEERLNSFLTQLQLEYAILDRIVYKNKNQHSRGSYFQYLMKMRRDLRLLQSIRLEEILTQCFYVIDGKKPKQKVSALECLNKSMRDNRKLNFMERLLGAARLLSQMVEPMLKAARYR
ncbi:hypothetical protein QQ045_000085 [Rhodiola kirilowii]